MRQSSVILYDKDECPFCWKVRLALTTKSLQVEHITIDTENKPADFLALSPTGKVPLLIVDAGSMGKQHAQRDYGVRKFGVPNAKSNQVTHVIV